MLRRTVIAFSLLTASVTAVFSNALSVTAATVGTGACTVTVDNATGVSASLDSAGACVVVFATAPTSPTTSQQFASRSWTVPAGINNVDVMVVAGGGGGGMSNGSTPTGGGGGGGGIVVATSYAVTPGATVTVKAGYGGQGGNCSPGNPGGNSSFGSLVAAGGGFGGGCGPAYGGPGGSAGGAHWGQPQGLAGQPTLGTPSNGSNITAYGSNGGKSYPHGTSGDAVSAGGGGGGGATADGGDATQPGANSSSGVGGNGGQGLTNNWRTGNNEVYGSGGGGQARSVQGVGGTNGGTASGTNAAGGAGIDAVDETGAGGGGGYRQGGGRAGDGGSGIVIVRYLVDTAPSNNTAPTISGTTTNGQSLTGARGTWLGYPTPTYTYQWKRSSSASGTYTNISGATSLNYTLTDSDVGQYIKLAVTATNSSGSATELSAASAQIADMVRPTTTTTSTTVALVIEVTAPASTVPSVLSQAATPKITTKTQPTTATGTNSTTTTSTVASSSTTTSVPAPNVQSVRTGEAAAQVDGESATASVQRVNNQLVVSVGELSATFGAMNASGTALSLDNDGNVHLHPGDSVQIKMSGFKPASTVEAWLFSTPTQLGTAIVQADGTVSGKFIIPKNVPTGAHRIAIVARTNEGKKATLAVGILVGNWAKEKNIAVWLIVVPIVLAVFGALTLPATRRRRLLKQKNVHA